MSEPQRHDRYVGPRPYVDTDFDRSLFFGREGEVNELLYRVMGNRILVLFGKSGHGKTSLLQAGLFPRLREQRMLPLPVRLNRRFTDPLKVFFEDIAEACAAGGVDYTPGEGAGLWEYFKTAAFWKEGLLLTPVLVLDQFEEIFTLLRDQERKAIARQLGELVDGRLPQRLRSKPREDDSEPYGEKPPTVKIILSLREEYLGTLQDLSSEISGLFENRFRLAAMNREQAREAVVRPAGMSRDELPHEGTFSTRPFRYDDGALEELVGFLAEGGDVEPFQLQMHCREIEKRVGEAQAAGREDVVVDRELLGGRERLKVILKGFYEDGLKKLPWRMRHRVRKLCGQGLLTSGCRCILEEKSIRLNYGVRADGLRVLVDHRLLRKEERSRLSYYELSHDSLVEAVLESNKEFRNRILRWEAGLLLSAVLAVVLVTALINREDSFQKEKQRLDYEGQTHEYDGDRLRDRGEWTAASKAYQLKLSSLNQLADLYPHDVELLRYLSGQFLWIGNKLKASGDREGALSAYQRSLRINQEMAKSQPDDNTWLGGVADSSISTGILLEESGDLKGAEEAFLKYQNIVSTLASKERDSAESIYRQSQFGWSYGWIGKVRLESGDLEGAEDAFRQEQKIFLELLTKEPGNPNLHENLGLAQMWMGEVRMGRGDLKGAEEAYRRYQEVFAELNRQDPKNSSWSWDLASSYRKIGDIKMALRDTEGAKEAYQEHQKILLELAASDPRNVEWQRELGLSHSRIGDVLQAAGDPWAAEDAYRQYLRALSTLVARYPDNTDWQVELGRKYKEVGHLRQARGDTRGAEQAFREYHKVFVELTSKEPGNTDWQWELGLGWERIGSVRLASADAVSAEEAFRHYNQIFSGLVAREPSNTNWQRELGLSWEMIGRVLRMKGDSRGAEEAFRQYQKVFSDLAARSSDDIDSLREVGVSWERIAEVLMEQGDLKGARKSIEHHQEVFSSLAVKEPDNSDWQWELGVSWNWIGDARMAAGDRRGAEDAYQRGLRIFSELTAREPGNMQWQGALGKSYRDVGKMRRARGDSKGAMDAYEKALDVAGLLTR